MPAEDLYRDLELGEWSRDAVCLSADAGIFFPEKGGSIWEAKQVCDTCPVTAECLAYALETGQHEGVWGGRSARERKTMRRRAQARGIPAAVHWGVA